ncbi:cellulase [Xylella fastidiosa]|nr:cellulase [Xylella fastidiosa]
MDSDWYTGYCERVKVTNTGSSRSSWTVTIPLKGTIQTLWSATWSLSGSDKLIASGLEWNKTIEPHGTTEFGFCANY